MGRPLLGLDIDVKGDVEGRRWLDAQGYEVRSASQRSKTPQGRRVVYVSLDGWPDLRDCVLGPGVELKIRMFKVYSLERATTRECWQWLAGIDSAEVFELPIQPAPWWVLEYGKRPALRRPVRSRSSRVAETLGGRHLLERAREEVSLASECRNNTLARWSFRIGGAVGAGMLTFDDAEDALVATDQGESTRAGQLSQDRSSLVSMDEPFDHGPSGQATPTLRRNPPMTPIPFKRPL
jgi:hypothetical protein